MDNREFLDRDVLRNSNSIRSGKDGVYLDIDVTPNSAKPGIKGYNRWRDRLMIKLRSQARRGRANTELLMFLSSILDIDYKKINIVKGSNSTEKTIVLSGLDRDQVIQRIFEAFNE